MYILRILIIPVNVDIQILSLQVPQGIQEKTQSTQGPVDKSIQESPREGAHDGEWLHGLCLKALPAIHSRLLRILNVLGEALNYPLNDKQGLGKGQNVLLHL